MNREFIKQNAGIDISKDDFKVTLSMLSRELEVKVKGSKSFNNNREGFIMFKTWLSDKSLTGIELHITMEATGVYYEHLAYFFTGTGS